jgi:hypothetical protein
MERSRRDLIRVLNRRIGEDTTEALVDFVHLTLKDNERMYNTHLKNLATKDDLAKGLANCATKDDLAKGLANCATKDDLAKGLANCATKDDLAKGLANCATKDDLAKGLANCATKDDLAGFATKIELKNETSRLELALKDETSRLELKISDFKSDILRWMFALFLTMMLALLGLYLKK